MYIKIFEWHPVHHVGQHLLHFKTKTKVYFVSVIFNLMNNLDPLNIVLTQTSTQPDAVIVNFMSLTRNNHSYVIRADKQR